MSEWIDVKEKDLFISEDDELCVWFEVDDFGNRYVVIPIEIVKKLLAESEKE